MTGPATQLLADIPSEWGPKYETQSGSVAHTLTGANSIELVPSCDMAVVMLTPQPGREVSLNSSRKSDFLAPIGTVEIIPATSELFARWKTPKENLLIALPPERLSRLAALEYGDETFELTPVAVGHVDPTALMLAGMIRDELHAGEQSNRLYLDSLLTVFSTHLLRNYSTFSNRRARQIQGGLSGRAWRAVQDYIKGNLADDLSLERLASVANLSPSHFLRAFRQTTGKSPHQYVLSARIELAERLVVTTDIPFPTIASLAGFANHSHMTACLRRHKSTTPSALRRFRIPR